MEGYPLACGFLGNLESLRVRFRHNLEEQLRPAAPIFLAGVGAPFALSIGATLALSPRLTFSAFSLVVTLAKDGSMMPPPLP